MNDILQIFGKADIVVSSDNILAYISLFDEDHYISEKIKPYIDEILHIEIKNIINRGFFKDRDDLRQEGARILKQEGYESLFNLAKYWVDHHMLYFDRPISKHSVLYNCDKSYWLHCRYHRLLKDRLIALGLYDKEIKYRLNKLSRHYNKLHLNDILQASIPDKKTIATADILVSYKQQDSNKEDKQQDLDEKTLRVIDAIKRGKYSVLTDYSNYIRLVNRDSEDYDCRNRKERMYIDESFNRYLKRNGVLWNGLTYQLDERTMPERFSRLLKEIENYWVNFAQYID